MPFYRKLYENKKKRKARINRYKTQYLRANPENATYAGHSKSLQNLTKPPCALGK